MITIKAIAKEAKVSEGTVDRVLHNRGGVSKKTEVKVKQILEKHNFKVNPIASALANKHTYKLATLIPNYDTENLFWKQPYLGILKASEDVKAYGVEVSNFTFDQFNSESYLLEFETLIKTKPAGVIIVPTFSKETKQIIQKLDALNIPYLFFNIDLNGFNNISFIGQDSYLGGYTAGKLMYPNLNEESKFLIIQTRLDVNNYHAIIKRIEGFKDYFEKNSIKIEIKTLQLENLSDRKRTKEQLNSYLKTHHNIRGIFVPSSRVSNIVNCMVDVHIKNKQLIGFDNTLANIKCLEDDKVSFLISQKPFDQGFTSVHVMTNFLTKKKVPSRKIYSPIDILTKENVTFNQRTEIEYETETKNLFSITS